MKTLRKREQKRRRPVKAKTRRRCRNRRGGSTTEQIGAAAQMRAFMSFLPEGQHPVHQALNDIVHHEGHNRFSDPQFNYDPVAQEKIEEAYKLIKQNIEIPKDIKKQMRIAKKKAERSSGVAMAPIIERRSPNDPNEDFPELPVMPPRPALADARVFVDPKSVILPSMPPMQPMAPMPPMASVPPVQTMPPVQPMIRVPTLVQQPLVQPPPPSMSVNVSATNALLRHLGRL